MQRARRRLLKILQDHRALKDGAIVDLENRRLAEWREGKEPGRLVGEIDMDALERHRLLSQRDGGALHIRAKVMADQGQRHGSLLMDAIAFKYM
jgi:hypothetical protein